MDKGTHATWTAGESPAGQESGTCCSGHKRLLAIAGLSADYWRLALQHGVQRFWIQFCADLGVDLSPLIPFGTQLLARSRARSGDSEQWRSRTLPGKYLGQARDTSGGHLVLVDAGGDLPILFIP